MMKIRYYQNISATANICVHCCHNQPKVGNDFFELISSSDTSERVFQQVQDCLSVIVIPSSCIFSDGPVGIFLVTDIIAIKVSYEFLIVYKSILLATL